MHHSKFPPGFAVHRCLPPAGPNAALQSVACKRLCSEAWALSTVLPQTPTHGTSRRLSIRLRETGKLHQRKNPIGLDGLRHAQLLADTHCRELWDLLVAWHGGPALGRRILPDRVFSHFPDKPTPVLTQVTQEIPPFHATAVCGTTLM